MRKISCVIIMAVALFASISTKSIAAEWSTSFQVADRYTDGRWESNCTFCYVVDPSVTLYSSATYGYDTWWVNEDYIKNVHGAPRGYSTKGRVTNSAGTGMETAFIPSTYSSGKADVPHTGEPVTFTGFLKSE